MFPLINTVSIVYEQPSYKEKLPLKYVIKYKSTKLAVILQKLQIRKNCFIHNENLFKKIRINL